MSKVRGIRGATTATGNTREAILEATKELLEKLIEANDIALDDIAAAILTTTPDLNAEFPAVAARQMGWTYVPLLCGHEMNIPDAQPRCIRALILVNTDKTPQDIVPVYLRDAINLRARGMNSNS